MIETRRYGTEGPLAIVVHGGPGAPGSVAGLAQGLADGFRVLEPFQRRSGDGPLTVSRHVEDLRDLVLEVGEDRPAIVGHSWGAMLTLAFAAAHPKLAGPLVLVGCGTFDTVARARFRELISERLTVEVRARLEGLAEEFPDPDERDLQEGRLFGGLYGFDLIEEEDEEKHTPGDSRGREETWADMIRQQEAGVYPAAFTAIRSPVLMLHGGHDPHPGRMIRDGLEPLLPGLDFHEWERCGHEPWRERQVREEFFDVLRQWLSGQLEPGGDD